MNKLRTLYYIAGERGQVNLLGLYETLDRYKEEYDNEWSGRAGASVHGYSRARNGMFTETDDPRAPLIEDTLSLVELENIGRGGGYVRLGAGALRLIDRSLKPVRSPRRSQGI